MRMPRLLFLTVCLLPSIAAAQAFAPAPAPYEPTVQVGGRVWFHWGHRRQGPPPTVFVSPPPPPVYYYNAPPPPAYYPAPPAYYPAPPPVYPPPPVVVQAPAPVVVATAVLPDWRARFGLGATFEGLFTLENGSNTGIGVLGQMRYRSARYLSLELMGGYERSSDRSGAPRTDVPITFGLIVPFLGPDRTLAPYLVVAGGVNFADLKLVSSPGLSIDDTRVQAVGQFGGGLELRLGHHFAINTDLRVEGRWNLNGASDQVKVAVVKIDGQPVLAIADTVGLRLGLGATVYF